MGEAVILDLSGDHQLARDLVAGGVFVPGCTLVLGDECALVLKSGSDELQVTARCVWVDGDRGAGLQLLDCNADLKQRIAAFAELGEGEAADDADADEGEARKIPLNVHERLRGLTLVQQIKIAQHGEMSERVVLERMYGKNVWEALLRNPRITGAEVARISRMGALPRPLVEIIVGNGGWLQIPEVRRALLANPRLGTDQILRVLRLLPRHELQLATKQTAYPLAVRDAAKRIMREHGG